MSIQFYKYLWSGNIYRAALNNNCTVRIISNTHPSYPSYPVKVYSLFYYILDGGRWMHVFPRHKTEVLWLASLNYKFRQQHLGQYITVDIGLYSRVCIFQSILICIFHVNKEKTQKLSYFKFRVGEQNPELEGKWKSSVQQSNYRQSLMPNVCLNCLMYV